jgi:nitrite reductase/ring-hydroxylating ferredoxin subunit
MTLVPVARVADVPVGAMLGADVNGERILIANVGGELFAMRATCNHMGGPLEEGTLEGNVVTRPLHGSKWDVKTGSLLEFVRPLPPEQTYAVTVKGDEILVDA